MIKDIFEKPIVIILRTGKMFFLQVQEQGKDVCSTTPVRNCLEYPSQPIQEVLKDSYSLVRKKQNSLTLLFF